jgi:hypothetical protein
VCERERERVSVCVRERESLCVYTLNSKAVEQALGSRSGRARESACERERVCECEIVREREREKERESLCVWGGGGERECVCVSKPSTLTPSRTSSRQLRRTCSARQTELTVV